MKHKIIFITVTLTLLSLLAKSQDKNTCQTIDHYVQKTLTAIQSLDTNGYIQLASYDTMLTILKVGSVKDTMQTQIYNQLKNNPDLFKSMFRDNFIRLAKTIRRDLRTDKWTIKFKDYKITNTEKDAITDHLSIKVNVEANGTAHVISMYVTKYRDCYYLFEPVDHYFSEY